MSFGAPTAAPAPERGHKKPSDSRRWRMSPHATALLALAIAVIAVALAVVAWIRPGSGKSFGDQDAAQAKNTVCAAWAPIHKTIWNGIPNPRPGDPVAADAQAANVRLTMIGGGSFLKETLDAEPATPAGLAKSITAAANTLQWMGVNYLAGNQSHAVLDPLKNNLDSTGAEIENLCKS